jgi:hypothetical protein
MMSRLEELTEDFGVTLKHMAEQSYKPMTNGDRIRSMTDEELAEFLWCFDSDEFAQEELRDGIWILTKRKLEEWLKQPVEE